MVVASANELSLSQLRAVSISPVDGRGWNFRAAEGLERVRGAVGRVGPLTLVYKSNRANQLYSADSVDPTRARRGVLPLLTSESG